jgi:hypothetical protein
MLVSSFDYYSAVKLKGRRVRRELQLNFNGVPRIYYSFNRKFTLDCSLLGDETQIGEKSKCVGLLNEGAFSIKALVFIAINYAC